MPPATKYVCKLGQIEGRAGQVQTHLTAENRWSSPAPRARLRSPLSTCGHPEPADRGSYNGWMFIFFLSIILHPVPKH